MRSAFWLVLLTACAVPAGPPPAALPPATASAPPVVTVQPPAPPPSATHVTPAEPPSATHVTPAEPPSKLSRLVDVSVSQRFPPLAAAHDERRGYGDVSLEHAIQAIVRATPDMVVTYLGGADPPLPAATYTLSDEGSFVPYPNPDVSRGGLRAFGLKTWFGYSPSATSYILFVHGTIPPLAAGTPGLVWQAQAREALFLSLDGETYKLALDPDATPLRFGAPPADDWPALSHVFGRAAFRTHRRNEIEPLGPRDKAFKRCAEFIWTATHKAMPPQQRQARTRPETAVILKHCAAPIRAWEEAFAKNLRANAKRRRSLWEGARARLAPAAR